MKDAEARNEEGLGRVSLALCSIGNIGGGGLGINGHLGLNGGISRISRVEGLGGHGIIGHSGVNDNDISTQVHLDEESELVS